MNQRSVFVSVLVAFGASLACNAIEAPDADPARPASTSPKGKIDPGVDPGPSSNDGGVLQDGASLDPALPPLPPPPAGDAGGGDAAAGGGGDAGVGGTDAGGDAGAAACAIDGIAWRDSEYQVVAKGRLWSIDGNGALKSPAAGRLLRNFSGLSQGPCANQGAVCRLDGFTWVADRSEYWVIYAAKTWTLDGDGALKSPAAGSNIDSIPAVAAGPCAGSAPGTCLVEGLTWRSDAQILYVVDKGKLWTFDGALAQIGAPALLSTYSGVQPMCLGVANCKIDDFTWRNDSSQFHLIAGGKAWFVDAQGVAVANSGKDLRTYSGFANGPCAP